MRTLVDFHRVDASLREFPHLCLGEPTTSRESHRLGGTAVNDLTVRGARAQQNLLEWSRRAAEPEQRPGGNPLVHGSRHQAKDLLELAEKVFAAMIAQQKRPQERPQEPEPKSRFAELPAPVIQNGTSVHNGFDKTIIKPDRIHIFHQSIHSISGADRCTIQAKEVLVCRCFQTALNSF